MSTHRAPDLDRSGRILTLLWLGCLAMGLWVCCRALGLLGGVLIVACLMLSSLALGMLAGIAGERER